MFHGFSALSWLCQTLNGQGFRILLLLQGSMTPWIHGFQTLGLHAFNALGLQGFRASLLQSALGIMWRQRWRFKQVQCCLMFKAELSCFGTCCVGTQSLTSFSVLGLLAFRLSSLSSAIGVGSQRWELKHVQLCFGFEINFSVFS